MVGRAYTMKEMKQTVEYIVEHRAYNEIRGRKMWMDLASSKILDRTWQSLKETFLKRILPDIYNPYYKLTVQQISSFKQECDLDGKNKNKLEIYTISEDSSKSDNHQVKDQIDKKESEETGEDKCSKIQNRTRSSTDTLVLENCYETAEDIQKDLESPKKTESAQKSFRDFITYSEPLTPMLQEVLHDFTSDDEPQMQIVEEAEGPPNADENTKKSNSPETIRESQSYTKKVENVANGEDTANKTQPSKIKSLKLKKTRKGTWENKEPVNEVSSTVEEKETNNNDSDMVFAGKENTTNLRIAEKFAISDKNNSNATTDTPLPNNQEELTNKPNQGRTSTESSTSEFLEPRKKKKEKSRKRSHSQSSVERKKKKDTKQDASETHEPEKETQTFDSHPQSTTLQKELLKGTENAEECDHAQSNETNDTNISPNVVVDDTAVKTNEGVSQKVSPSIVNPADINPCLKSVSLYEEQFSQSKYSDSDEDAIVQNNNQTDTNHSKENHEKQNNDEVNHGDDNISKEMNNTSNQSKETTVVNTKQPTKNLDNIVLLKSHSETSSDHFELPKKKYPVGRNNISRDTALANVFGFASGGVSYKRTQNRSKSRRFSQRRRITNRTYNVDSSGSSDEYTTASDSDDTQPNSSRNNGHKRQYIKPPSYDILSHENGLFVVGRKKIYPLMVKENGSLHYAWSSKGNDIDQADSYWKAKYLEEKKKLAEEKLRADELARLLQRAQDAERAKEPNSPIYHQTLNKKQQDQAEETVVIEPDPKPDEKVKIKFNRNKEVELEGQWPNINPILEKMVELFKTSDAQDTADSKKNLVKESETKIQDKSPMQKEKTNAKSKRQMPPRKATAKENMVIQIRDSVDENKKPEHSVTISSDKSTSSLTPANSETHEKVNKLESEIFEKIAEIDKTDQSTTDTNVTKRKPGRPRKISTVVRTSASLDTASKRASSVEKMPNKNRALSIEKAAKKRRTTSEGPGANKPDQTESDAGPSKRPTKAPRRYGSDSHLTVNKPVRSQSKLSLAKSHEISKTEEVSFSEDDHILYKFPPAKTKKTAKSEKSNRRYSTNEPGLTSPDNSTRQSESTPSYQDSDITSPNITRRRKKMTTVNLVHKKGFIKKVKRKSCPYLADDDSTNDAQIQKTDIMPSGSPTLNSEVYRSESYQILMPVAKQFAHLDKIDKNSLANQTEINKNFKTLHPLTAKVDEFYIHVDENNSSKLKSSEANSSSVSLPLSPEISVVENLSVSKDLISSGFSDPLNINEVQSNDTELSAASSNKYMISGVDVSMPLMTQECNFLTRNKNKLRNRRSSFSESILQEQHSSESLDQKLRDLLLESAKKIAQEQTEVCVQENAMEVDIAPKEENKTKTKKRRSSTPRKKISVQRSKTPVVQPVVEEHTESCSRNGRTSCPPVIHVIACEENVSNTNKNTERGRRNKKDVIKVKILRPRSKSYSKDRSHSSKLSVCTDSGINDTESGVSEGCQCCNVSEELIHNHSDTCLHMDECVGDSVELVEDLSKSIISLNTNSIPSEIQSQRVTKDASEKSVTAEMYCSNARDATNLNSAKKCVETNADNDGATIYHTPPSQGSFNSIITDDLSDECQPPALSKWYLLSDEDSMFSDIQSQSNSMGSNLNKIFTSCAIPDLSTISEGSKENDTKTVVNTDTTGCHFAELIRY